MFNTVQLLIKHFFLFPQLRVAPIPSLLQVYLHFCLFSQALTPFPSVFKGFSLIQSVIS